MSKIDYKIMSKQLNSYDLSRNWFDWCFENPEKIKPTHTALYFFCIEHCNRLGWKEKFGLPTTMAKEALGISSYNTYINCLNDLVEFGFIKLIEKSKNQYSSNIIALSNFDKATNKALDKALIKHDIKQRESTDSINKQETINKEQITNPLISEIINHLNSTCKKDYKSNSKKTIDCINARINEKFTLEDFKSVINDRFLKWGEDEKMKEYLRPETLFGNKFESYLQSSKVIANTEFIKTSKFYEKYGKKE